MRRRHGSVVRFSSAVLGVALPVLVIAGLLGGSGLLLQGCWALAICLLLGGVSLEVSLRALAWGPVWQLGVILGGSCLRAGLALAAGFLLFWLVPVCHAPTFFMWLGASYVLTLALEVSLLVNALKRAGASALDRPDCWVSGGG